MLKELFKHFKQFGYEKIFVEDLEDNKTRYFYEYYGARLVKTVQIKIGGKILNELIYVWNNIDDVIERV